MLGVPKARNKGRTLSVVQFSDLEKSKMDSSIDQLDSLIKQVKRSWKVSTQENSNPLEIALPLLDNTSVGMAYKHPDFLKLTDKISQSLQVAVDEHYQAFNNSVGSYDTICHSINESQQTVKNVKLTLKQISSDISSKNQLLTELNQSSKQYGDMVEILDVIEDFKKLPNQVDNLFADKKFSKIEEVISNADLQAKRYKLWRIPALNNIKNYLLTAKQNLFDTILEELNATIYLKSKSSTLLSLVNRGSTSGNSVNFGDDFSNLELYINNIVNIDVLEKSSFIQTNLNNFLEDFDRRNKAVSSYQQSDFENDPYRYLHLLLDTLAKLNKLPKALKLLAQRHPTELHKIVKDTADETKIKHPNLEQNGSLTGNKVSGRRGGAKSRRPSKNALGKKDDPHSDLMKGQSKLVVDFGLSIGDLNNIVLQDFFWQIFTKFLLVLQSHRVVFEITRKLTDLPEKQLTSNTNSYDFIEIWKNISSEVRSLMYSYITNDAVMFNDSKLHSSSSSGTKNANTPLGYISDNWNANALFENNKKKQSNFRSATIFQFDEDEFQDASDNKSLNDLHSQELKNFLKEVFPGFKINENLSSALVSNSATPYLENEEFTQQETLVPANVFNMRVILESLLVFVQGSKSIFPELGTAEVKGTNEPIDFFNDFMKKTFLPQLDETLEYMYDNTVNIEPFKVQAIPNFKISGGSLAIASSSDSAAANDVKVFKSGVDFYNLFTRLCQIFNTTIKYREEYTSLIIQLLIKFYNKYDDLYNDSLPHIDQQTINTQSSFKQLNRWLKSPELSHISLQILNSKTKVDRSILSTETEMLLSAGSKLLRGVDKTQILHPKNFDILTQLLSTVDWILRWLPEMKRKVAQNVDGDEADTTSVDYLRSNWELIESNQTNLSNLKKVQLTFDNQSPLLDSFDRVIKDFEKLLSNTLLAIRYDIRLRLIYYITATITNNPWNPNSDINAICPEVKELTNLIQLFNAKLFSNLDPILGHKILYGIPNLIDKVFIVGAELIPVLNGNGIKKIYLNIITIQQSLRTIMNEPDDVDFTHSLAYFDLFKKGIDKILEQNKANKSLFNLQENKNMVRLIFSQELKDHERDPVSPLALNKRYHDILVELQRSHGNARR